MQKTSQYEVHLDEKLRLVPLHTATTKAKNAYYDDLKLLFYNLKQPKNHEMSLLWCQALFKPMHHQKTHRTIETRQSRCSFWVSIKGNVLH